MANKSIHTGHRERLKQRFLEEGLDGFTDVQALELLLFYAIPQKDTNPIAHALLERFESLSRVLEAPVEELVKIPGISTHSAALIHLMTELNRVYQVDRVRNMQILNTITRVGEYMIPYFSGRTRETVFLLCLDARCKVLCCKEIGEGGINSASISPRKVVETALAAGATSVVLAHNHPSGIAMPSAEDLQATRRVSEALATVDIILADHLIVADGDYVSMSQSGYRFDK